MRKKVGRHRDTTVECRSIFTLVILSFTPRWRTILRCFRTKIGSWLPKIKKKWMNTKANEQKSSRKRGNSAVWALEASSQVSAQIARGHEFDDFESKSVSEWGFEQDTVLWIPPEHSGDVAGSLRLPWRHTDGPRGQAQALNHAKSSQIIAQNLNAEQSTVWSRKISAWIRNACRIWH